MSGWYASDCFKKRFAKNMAIQVDSDVPVVPCDVTDRESVKAVLLALLYAVVDSLDESAAAQAT